MPPTSILSQHFKPVKMAGHSGATEAAQKFPSAASSRHVSVPPMTSIVWTRNCSALEIFALNGVALNMGLDVNLLPLGHFLKYCSRRREADLIRQPTR